MTVYDKLNDVERIWHPYSATATFAPTGMFLCACMINTLVTIAVTSCLHFIQSTNSQEEVERIRSKGYPPKKVHTSESMLNFELTYDNGNINLLYKGRKVIDLSHPEKWQAFNHSLTLKLEF